MEYITATNARSQLYRLIDQVNASATPVRITGQRGDAVLVGAADWEAIQETLYLQSVPGMVATIHNARREGLGSTTGELKW